jgi:hypothetical protein
VREGKKGKVSGRRQKPGAPNPKDALCRDRECSDRLICS